MHVLGYCFTYALGANPHWAKKESCFCIAPNAVEPALNIDDMSGQWAIS